MTFGVEWWGPALIAAASSAWEGSNNRDEARASRNWQEDMSGSAYSRAALDLQSAGLNRVLALGNPASTPAGATASMSRPNIAEAGIMGASAKQSIAQSRAEEKLIGQKQQESVSSEALNKALEVTQQSQQGLNAANAVSALSQAKLLDEQARKVKIEADRTEVTNPLYEAAGQLTRWLDNYLRNSAKASNDGWWPKLKEGASNFFHDDPDSGWWDEAAKENAEARRNKTHQYRVK